MSLLRNERQKCAEKRTKQLAHSRNVVECRRLPEGEMKFAVGMVVRQKNDNVSRSIVYWNLDDKSKMVGYTEGVRTRSQTTRKPRPYYVTLSTKFQFLKEGNLMSDLFLNLKRSLDSAYFRISIIAIFQMNWRLFRRQFLIIRTLEYILSNLTAAGTCPIGVTNKKNILS